MYVPPEVLIDFIAQKQPGAVESGFYRGLIDSHYLGHFFGIKLLNVPEQEHLAVFGGQFLKNVIDESSYLTVHKLFYGGGQPLGAMIMFWVVRRKEFFPGQFCFRLILFPAVFL